MRPSVQDIANQVIALPAEERAELADLLLASLPGEDEVAVDAAWEQELQRRVAAIRAGSARLVAGDDVHERARKLLGR